MCIQQNSLTQFLGQYRKNINDYINKTLLNQANIIIDIIK